MRIILPALTFLPVPALAHIGHLGDVGGHDHWIALGGIAVAGAIALWGARKKPKDAQPQAPDDIDTPDEEEASA